MLDSKAVPDHFMVDPQKLKCKLPPYLREPEAREVQEDTDGPDREEEEEEQQQQKKSQAAGK